MDQCQSDNYNLSDEMGDDITHDIEFSTLDATGTNQEEEGTCSDDTHSCSKKKRVVVLPPVKDYMLTQDSSPIDDSPNMNLKFTEGEDVSLSDYATTINTTELCDSIEDFSAEDEVEYSSDYYSDDSIVEMKKSGNYPEKVQDEMCPDDIYGNK